MKAALIYKGKPYSFAQVKQHWNKNRAAMMPVLGQTAVNFFKDRFKAQAWTDRYAEKWEPRKKQEKGKRRALLVKSARMRNSIRLVSANASHALIGVPVKYAAVHNYGFNGTVNVKQHTRSIRGRVTVQNIDTRRKSTRKVQTGSSIVRSHTRSMDIPQRQFVGNSETLNRKFDRIVINNIDKSFEL
ncbi:MAG: phage virion morphogenesis protein [Bacteroidales bacterium]|nr:phage virion morphogenesis protein [Bacteroidales bacterium]